MENNNNTILKKYKDVEEKIGYEFENTSLLFQAFTRSSFAKAHDNGLDNECLEFLGDQILSFYVTKYIFDRQGNFKYDFNDLNNGDYDEMYFYLREYDTPEKLDELKKSFVDNEMLAHRIDVLDLGKYFIASRSDINQDVLNETKVKGDLFESIIAAVAIDSKYNVSILEKVINKMLDMDNCMTNGFDIERNDYISAINEWYQKRTNKRITYSISYDYELKQYEAGFGVKINGESMSFNGYGESIYDAKKACAKGAYLRVSNKNVEKPGLNEFLSKANLGNSLTIENSLALINYLFQIKKIEQPMFDCCENPFGYDHNGNPIWECTNRIIEVETSNIYQKRGFSSNIKDAKKHAAYLNLCDLFNLIPLYDQYGKLNKTSNDNIVNSEYDTETLKIYVHESRNKNIADINITLKELDRIAVENIKAKRDYFEITSLELQNRLGLKNRIPSMCNAMRKFSKKSDFVYRFELISNPNILNASTYKMRYYLKY